MKESPILFRGPLVRAILSGQKTVTRRVIKQATGPSLSVEMLESGQALLSWLVGHGPGYEVGEQLKFVDCPYGVVGDRLWVREAWIADAQVDAVAPRDLSQGEPLLYPADGAMRLTGCSLIGPGKTRPSIHMPRWACRILLEITDVRVERLQDISEEQAMAEGIDLDCLADGQAAYDMVADHNMTGRPTAIGAFRDLWASINGIESWNDNPWLWVIEFKRVTL